MVEEALIIPQTSRSSEATLATSFAQLQLKKMELEFSVDPLFKKASADFDEGGAKGLLLNHLCIDNTGRIVFDSSDDTQDDSQDESRRDSMLEEGSEDTPTEKDSPQEPPVDSNAPIDISTLATRFFPDLTRLDTQSICPSLQTFELGDGHGTLDLPFLKAADDWRKSHEDTHHDSDNDDARSGIVLDDDNALGFDDDVAGFDLPASTGFGEGGEAWAKEAHIAPQMRVGVVALGSEGEGDALPGAEGEGEVGTFSAHGAASAYGVTLTHRPGADEHDNILSYFDAAMAKNWAGPEHWKIAKIKSAAKQSTSAPTKRKEKEPFEIDFLAPMGGALAEMLAVPASSNAQISLPKKDWKSRTRNLLPDDKHFSSRDLLRLFLKPKARVGSRGKGAKQQQRGQVQAPEGEVDEAYWAQTQAAEQAQAVTEDGDGQAQQGGYDADFFQDDGLDVGPGVDEDEEEFADAREALSPAAEGTAAVGIDAVAGMGSQGAWGDNLITQSRRLRPEYVQYARVAKKVDVRRLKEEMWRGIGLEVSLSLKTLFCICLRYVARMAWKPGI